MGLLTAPTVKKIEFHKSKMAEMLKMQIAAMKMEN